MTNLLFFPILQACLQSFPEAHPTLAQAGRTAPSMSSPVRASHRGRPSTAVRQFSEAL